VACERVKPIYCYRIKEVCVKLVTCKKSTWNMLPNILFQGLFHMQRKLLEIINVDFDVTGQLLTIYSTFLKYLRRNGSK